MLSRISALRRHVAGQQRTVSMTLLREHSHRPLGGYAAVAGFHATTRSAASASDLSDELPIMKKLSESPKVIEQLREFTLLLQKKGFDPQGKPPTFFEMMQIIKDPEMKESLTKLSNEMTAAGIHIDMETIAAFQKASSKEFGNVKDKQEDSGIMNKMKDLFKKD